MIDGQISDRQAKIAGDLADLCLESRVNAAKLKSLLQAHQCGPDAEAIMRRIECATREIAKRVQEASAATPCDGALDSHRTRDPWMAVSC